MLAVDPTNPSTLYAGTLGGRVFKSTDMGAHWAAINNGLTTIVLALAVDPTNSSTLYAGGRGGVFKSTDMGAHWAVINNGLTNYEWFQPTFTIWDPKIACLNRSKLL